MLSFRRLSRVCLLITVYCLRKVFSQTLDETLPVNIFIRLKIFFHEGHDFLTEDYTNHVEVFIKSNKVIQLKY